MEKQHRRNKTPKEMVAEIGAMYKQAKQQEKDMKIKKKKSVSKPKKMKKVNLDMKVHREAKAKVWLDKAVEETIDQENAESDKLQHKEEIAETPKSKEEIKEILEDQGKKINKAMAEQGFETKIYTPEEKKEIKKEKSGPASLPINVEYKEKTPEKFNIKLPAKEFLHFINANEATSDDPKMIIRKDGIEIIAMNPSSVDLIHSKYPAKYISKWDVDEGVLDVLSLSYLKKQIGKLDKNDELSIVKEGNELKFMIKGMNGESREFSTQVGTDTNIKMAAEPHGMELDDMPSFKIPAKELKDILSNVKKVNTIMSAFAVKDGKLEIKYKNEGAPEEGYPKEVSASYPVMAEKDIPNTAGFNIEYMQQLLKGADKDTEVKVYLKDMQPLKIEYSNGTEDYRGWLAPYIES